MKNTYTEQLIDAGIKGGWKPHNLFTGEWSYCNGIINYHVEGVPLASQMWIEKVLLDSDFFRAVGKSLGWNSKWEWYVKMHSLLDHIINKGSIESWAKTLFDDK